MNCQGDNAEPGVKYKTRTTCAELDFCIILAFSVLFFSKIQNLLDKKTAANAAIFLRYVAVKC